MATKFNVAKEKILDGLQRVQNVVSTRTTLRSYRMFSYKLVATV